MALISFEEAVAHLRMELDHDDSSPPVYDDERVPDISNKMLQAEAIVLNYLGLAEAADIYASPPPVRAFTANDVEIIRAAIFDTLSALFDADKARTIVEAYAMNVGTV